MPEMNGDEATMQIREDEKETGRTPVIITAYTANKYTQEKIEELKSQGFDSYLQKPQSQMEIHKHLNEALANRPIRTREECFSGISAQTTQRPSAYSGRLSFLSDDGSICTAESDPSSPKAATSAPLPILEEEVARRRSSSASSTDRELLAQFLKDARL